MKLLVIATTLALMVLPASNVSAQPRCSPGISPDLCQQAQTALDRHLREITAGNVSTSFVDRLRQAPERPLNGTPCFFQYGRDLQGVITKCVLPRAIANPLPDRPVTLRATKQDACYSQGDVVGLDPNGDNYLSVRGGPSGQHREIDRLGSGAEVAICGESGNWLAVVYSRDRALSSCDVSSSTRATRPYRGPCRSGWVHRRYVRIIAG